MKEGRCCYGKRLNNEHFKETAIELFSFLHGPCNQVCILKRCNNSVVIYLHAVYNTNQTVLDQYCAHLTPKIYPLVLWKQQTWVPPCPLGWMPLLALPIRRKIQSDDQFCVIIISWGRQLHVCLKAWLYFPKIAEEKYTTKTWLIMKEKFTLNDKALIRYSDLRRQCIIEIQDSFANNSYRACGVLSVT